MEMVKLFAVDRGSISCRIAHFRIKCNFIKSETKASLALQHTTRRQ